MGVLRRCAGQHRGVAFLAVDVFLARLLSAGQYLLIAGPGMDMVFHAALGLRRCGNGGPYQFRRHPGRHR